MYSHAIAFVPHTVVKDILNQDLNGKRGKWIVVILEYDLEIRPTKLIKGQGLAKLVAEANFRALDINMIHSLDEQEELATPPIEEAFFNSLWYADILYLIFNLNAPPALSKTKARFLKPKVVNFYILDRALYWKNSVGILLKCLLEDVDRIVHEFHEGECGGHL